MGENDAITTVWSKTYPVSALAEMKRALRSYLRTSPEATELYMFRGRLTTVVEGDCAHFTALDVRSNRDRHNLDECGFEAQRATLIHESPSSG